MKSVFTQVHSGFNQGSVMVPLGFSQGCMRLQEAANYGSLRVLFGEGSERGQGFKGSVTVE